MPSDFATVRKRECRTRCATFRCFLYPLKCFRERFRRAKRRYWIDNRLRRFFERNMSLKVGFRNRLMIFLHSTIAVVQCRVCLLANLKASYQQLPPRDKNRHDLLCPKNPAAYVQYLLHRSKYLENYSMISAIQTRPSCRSQNLYRFFLFQPFHPNKAH